MSSNTSWPLGAMDKKTATKVELLDTISISHSGKKGGAEALRFGYNPATLVVIHCSGPLGRFDNLGEIWYNTYEVETMKKAVRGPYRQRKKDASCAERRCAAKPSVGGPLTGTRRSAEQASFSFERNWFQQQCWDKCITFALTNRGVLCLNCGHWSAGANFHEHKMHKWWFCPHCEYYHSLE